MVFCIVLFFLYFAKLTNHINGTNDKNIVNFSFSEISQSQFMSRTFSSFDI